MRKARRYEEAADVFTQIAEREPREWLAHYNAGAVLLEANRLAESAAHLERAVRLHETAAGYALYANVQALGGDMPAARVAFESALRLSPNDYDANWGLFEVTQLLDDNPAALRHQRIALAQRSLRTIVARATTPRTTILELCIAGTFQANIPLDFVVDLETTTVHKLFLGEHPIPPLPPYDLVFNTIAEAPNAGPALEAAAQFIAGQNRPVIDAPGLIPLTSREAVAERFNASPSVTVAQTVKVTRASAPQHRMPFPFLIRPLGSHAGNDLAKVNDTREFEAYLRATPHADEFYLTEFIDYRNVDGFYRKYRFAYVDGVAFPVHLAISPRWMIHYYNAAMAENAWMRAEEHAFMRDMDAIFNGTLAAGLREIAQSIPLDYFGIDCSIAPDGRLLLFEASTAMIVHLLDPVDLYPYKAQYVPRVIHALEWLFDKRLGRGPGG